MRLSSARNDRKVIPRQSAAGILAAARPGNNPEDCGQSMDEAAF
jgi:hypothetical protein